MSTGVVVHLVIGGVVQLDWGTLTDLGRLTDPAPGPPGVTYIALVVFFVLMAGAGGVVSLSRRHLFSGHSLKIGLAARFGTAALALGILGVTLLVARYLSIPYLSARLLLLVTAATSLGFLVYLIYFVRFRYPALLVVHQSEGARQRSVVPRRGKGRRSGKKRRR